MCNAKIKICGLYRECDIDYVNQYKPDYIGFIFWPKSHRYVTSDLATTLKARLDKNIQAVGVFVDEDKDVIVKIAKNGIIDVVQLHGNETEADVRYIKEQTGKQVIKAVKIVTGEELKAWEDSEVDYLLLDSGMGTGKTFDWSKADRRPEKPFFLAGGIGAENVRQAVEVFKPYAVDLSSSVETERKKDPEKIKAVIQALRGGF